MRRKLSFTLALALFIFSKSFPQAVQKNWWVPNNTVRTIEQSGDMVYLGGEFTSFSALTPYGTALSIANAMPNLNYSTPNGAVFASAPDGTGGWYIGGAFTKVGEIERNHIAHINADGSLDSWNPNAKSTWKGADETGANLSVGFFPGRELLFPCSSKSPNEVLLPDFIVKYLQHCLDIRIAILGDNKLVREGLQTILNGTLGFIFCGVFSDGNQWGMDIRSSQPDVVLMDNRNAGIKWHGKGTKYLRKVPSYQDTYANCFEWQSKKFLAFCAGASGYILKNESPHKYMEAMNDVYNGGAPICSSVAKKYWFFGKP